MTSTLSLATKSYQSTLDELEHELAEHEAGETVYGLRMDGKVVDSHRYGEIPKRGSMFATLSGEGQRPSVRVDVLSSWLRTKFKLLLNDVETPLMQSSEAEIKALWHTKQMC